MFRKFQVVVLSFLLLLLPSIVTVSFGASQGSSISASTIGVMTSAGVVSATPMSTQKCDDCFAGYVDTSSSGGVTAVSAKFKVPTLSCTSTTAISIFLVGIDGFSSTDFGYASVHADCYNGVASYGAYWADYNSNQAVATSWTPSAGNVIALSVSFSSGKFKFTLKDLTTKQTTTATSPATGAALTSAECVTDTVKNSMGTILPLSDFGKLSFTKCMAEINSVKAGIGGFSSPVVLTKYICYDSTGTSILAEPGALSKTNHENFHVTWVASGP